MDPQSYKSVQKWFGISSTRNANITINEKTEITEQHVKDALEKLKNRKSSGWNKIVNELLKYGEDILIKQVQVLIPKQLHKINFLMNGE